MTRDNEHFGSDLGWSLAALVRENTGNPRVTTPELDQAAVETPETEPAYVGFEIVPVEDGDERFDIDEMPDDEAPLPEDGEEDFDIPTVQVGLFDEPTYDEIAFDAVPVAETPEPEPVLEPEPEHVEDFSLMLPDFDPSKYLNLAADTNMGADPALTRALADEAQAATEGREVIERVEYPPVNIPAEAGPRDPRTVMLMLQELAALREY